jgi:hypothetical protein
MNLLEITLYKTRKSVLDACTEIGYNNVSEIEIRLKQCNCCGIWLKTMKLDLDGNDICDYCLDAYGP